VRSAEALPDAPAPQEALPLRELWAQLKAQQVSEALPEPPEAQPEDAPPGAPQSAA